MLLKLSWPAYWILLVIWYLTNSEKAKKELQAITYRIPDLQLDIFVGNLDCSGTELDTDGQIMLLSEAFVCELQQQARFTDTYYSKISVWELILRLRLVFKDCLSFLFSSYLYHQWWYI